MEDKIKLEEIVGYLPYDLKCHCMGEYKGGTKIPEVFAITAIDRTFIEVNDGFGQYDFDEIWPLLHPLSNLTKEIEVNGEKFIPIEALYRLSDYYDFLQQIEEDSYEMNNPCRWPYEIVQKLYEWHFDIHRFINIGLAKQL